MAKRKESRYVFNASAKTVKFPGHIDLNGVLAIINVTSNQTIYALTENGKGGTVSHTHPTIGSDPDFPYSYDGVCVLTLDYDTTSMSNTDELLIFLEDERKGLRITPHELGLDPIERTRVSNPSSLIDADFEYGLQNTKWQSFGSNQNYPSFTDSANTYYAVTNVTAATASNGFSTITVAMTGTLPAAGTAVYVSGTTSELANGPFLVLTSSGGSFTYLAKGAITAGTIYTTYTLVRAGTIYTGAPLPITNLQTTLNSTTVTINFSSPHNLIPGSPIAVYDSGAGQDRWEGNFFVNEVVDSVTVRYTMGAQALATATISTSTIYALSPAFWTHRPLDGGVVMGPFFPIHGLDAKRQTKRYFRYQSGKAIVFASGILMSPTFEVLSATYSAPDITITTALVHGLQPGAQVILSGIDSANYNGTYRVKAVTSDTSFTVAAASAPSVTPADISDTPQIVVSEWCGSSVRSGIFDDSNGLFWEYDGQELYAVKRSSTAQLVGTVSITKETTTVTGTNTRFTSQLKIGQHVQIRGRVYQIASITNDTTMSISPEYNGNTNISGATYCKITEFRVPRSKFNFDTLDGTGPSGYNINLQKMQMFGIQYSWYGAGYADFLLRTVSGEYIIAHRMVNNNQNTEAYMRSGNLPARYEVDNTSPAFSYLSVASGTTPTTNATLTLSDASYFPTPISGFPLYVLLSSLISGTTYHEIISYTGKTGNQLTGVTRTATMSVFLSGSTRNFQGTTTVRNHPIGTTVRLISVTAAPTVSHWGSAVIIDGGFDDDTGYSFSHTVRGTVINSLSTNTCFFFRPAPSVSDNTPGEYGQRDTINRSQTKLTTLEINNRIDTNIEIVGVLNPTNIPITPSDWKNSSSATIGVTPGFYQPCFAQVYDPLGVVVPADGEIVFRFLANGVGRFEYNLSRVKEIQNSLLGGEGIYPNGPEVLAIVVRNNSGSQTTVDANLKWEEAQA